MYLVKNRTHLLTGFGYCSNQTLLCSLVKPNLMKYLLPIAFVCSSVSMALGLSAYATLALSLLLTLELITGILASRTKAKARKKKKWFSLHRLAGWGLKVFILFFTLFFLTALIDNYKINGRQTEEYIFRYLHSLVVIYITGIYLLSVYENIGTINKDKKSFKKLKEYLFDNKF